ncbi:hypothetical protein BKP35_05380 [Anaerobacillus arseniciselenatis]|uniref:Uncharacterized protein n=1 Tax=Anaerobacillus arseniciselenatis TaxID=85682 RepID=A0A1S2LSU3_9BACI|nr:hypothetical protein [Anaerobacillus arseniciselenatis]OIJ15280.1 hypothetical protein BKP35_05380 [Anaerobacillus arseniciselenatis]
MKWAMIFGITILTALILWYELPKINQNQKKDKYVLIALSAMSWVLAVLLLFFPNMPGPTELVDQIYKPLGKLLE